MPALALIDWLMLGALALSVAVGLWRGLLLEVGMLVGWLVAYFAAQWFAADLAPHVPVGAPGSGINRATAFVLVFFGVLLAWALAARLVRMIVHATPLSVVDRIGGGAFGLLRGGVLLVAVSTLVAFTPAAQSVPWRESVGARWATDAVRFIKPLLPPDLREWFPRD